MKFLHVNPGEEEESFPLHSSIPSLEEAVKIHFDLGSRRSMAIHWGTFSMTREYWLEPKILTLETAAAKGLADGEFAVVNIGETVSGAS